MMVTNLEGSNANYRFRGNVPLLLKWRIAQIESLISFIHCFCTSYFCTIKLYIYIYIYIYINIYVCVCVYVCMYVYTMYFVNPRWKRKIQDS